MIKLRLGFGEFYLIFTVTAETLLDGSSCLIYDTVPPRMIVPSKYYFTAVIIDHFQMNTFDQNIDCGCASMSRL